MAGTASDSAAIGPNPLPAIPEKCMHKNRLQEFAQRTHTRLPIYRVEFEGEYHLPRFKCTVEVDGQLFSSSQSFSRRKDAEQDAARVAYETLVATDKVNVKDVSGLIDQDVVFCKSILHEFSAKMKTTQPSYSVASQEKPMTLFVASVAFDGSIYTGEAAANKKDAEQKAARAAVKSILAKGNTCMMEIIRSKEKLITAIGSSRNRNAVKFTPIKFTRAAAYTGSGEKDYVALESQDPSMNPSTETVTQSRKRKGTVDPISNISEERVAKGH